MLFWCLVIAVAALLVALRNRQRIDEIDRRRDGKVPFFERRLAQLEEQLKKSDSRNAPTAEPAPEPEASKPITPVVAAPPETPSPVIPPTATGPEGPPQPTISRLQHEQPSLTRVPPREPSITLPPRAGAGVSGPPSPPFRRPAIDWEGLVGVKLFSWVAGIALVFAAIFFLRYSIEHGWLSPPIRMAIGLGTGVGLLIFCELHAARRYAVTANALDAAGIAILFATLFASHALWHLLPQAPVFLLMTLVTAVAVLLSIRRDSVFIALLGLVGGFATPALLSTGQDRPIGLFGYLLLLNGGLAWVAYRKAWPWLTALSVVLTALYQWTWVLKFLDASRLPLAMSIFAVFPILHVAAIALAERGAIRRQDDESSGTGLIRRALDPLFGLTAVASAVLPAVLGLYMAAIPAYGAQYILLFSFLFLVAVGLSLIAVVRGPRELYALGAVASVAAFVIWFALSYRSAAWPGILCFVAVFAAFYAANAAASERLGLVPAQRNVAAVTAAVLLVAFPILAAIEPATAAPGVLFGVLFGLLIVLAVASLRETGRMHSLSAFFALATEAIWSAKHLSPEHLLAALIIYGGFGLFYLAVPVIAERWQKRLEPEGSGALVAFASLALLFFLATGPVAHAALWTLAVLVAILNAGLLFEAAHGRFFILSALGILLSWILFAVWWWTAVATVVLIPALMVVAGFALLVLGGHLWVAHRTSSADERGLQLALIAYVFLAVVAAHRALAIPPWPLFGVVCALDLAIATAALYTRRGAPYCAALSVSQLVLIIWAPVARDAPWPLTAMLAAAAVVVLALIWIGLARRRGATDVMFPGAAVSSILLGQLLAIIVGELPGTPAVSWLVADQVALLVALLAVAWAADWHELAVIGIIPTAVASALWLTAHLTPATWTSGLLFSGALYAVFLAYPLVLGARAREQRLPYLAAVLAGIPFFFLARRCIIVGGFGDFIGALPVSQAVLMLVLLVRLLRLQPPSERDMGRLALVAGTALAGITVAIPLQLERQWLTIGWALEGAALAWLFRRIPHRGVLAWSAGLCASVFVRLCLNPAVLSYHPRGAMPIWNWYLYTYLLAAAALFAAARLLRNTDDHIDEHLRVSDLLPAGGTILLFLLLNIEIADFYSTGPTLTFNLSADLAQDLTYTLGWAMFAIGLLAAGIARASRAARIAAIVLLAATVVKCFLHDLWRLGGLYRVGSFVALALSLALVAVLLQRFVLGTQKEAA